LGPHTLSQEPSPAQVAEALPGEHQYSAANNKVVLENRETQNAKTIILLTSLLLPSNSNVLKFGCPFIQKFYHTST